MVKKERIERYLKKRRDAIDAHLADFCARKDPEALHQLRVEIKKLNAVLFLLQACAPQGADFPVKPLKKVFRAAGVVRSAQVNLQLLASHGIHSPAFERQQQGVIEKGTGDFCRQLPTWQHGVKRVFKTLLPTLPDLKGGAVLRFYRKELQGLNRFFIFPFDLDALHDHRKVLKNLMYVHALLPKTLATELNLDTDFVDMLQDRIGTWHDSILTLELLAQNGIQDEALLGPVRQKADELLSEIVALTEDVNWHKAPLEV